jgi:quercetin dioxygenase-like cupin family protein
MKRLMILFFVILSSYCTVTAQSKKAAESSFQTKILSGKVYFVNKQAAIDTLKWHPHPAFKGVYLKHLALGKDTQNRLSCHIVKIDPNCLLDTHKHDGQIEIHEVVGGSGKFYLDGKEFEYSVGKISVIPANTVHKVVAGKDGLYLFAKFTPALQ